jgi:ribosomal protein S12 methylthiotransferase
MPDQVPTEVAEARRDALMQQQQRISLARNQSFVGRTLTTLIEGVDEAQGLSFGRSYRDAPEVDGLVIVEGLVPLGEMVPIKITGALEYDLTGVVDLQKN